MAKVTLKKVSRVFAGGAIGVKDLDLSIEDGELLALVGPSGCGKSTTLHLMAGLESPSSGSILIDGADVTSLSPGERDVAMVFQSYALYPHLDVRGNLAFPLKIARVPRDDIDERVRETAELLGLSELLSRKPRDLSGGQRQRVALGRALVRRPKVFLFDEPLSNLDPALRASMRGELKKLHERLRATFVYVTHDQAESMTLADRVAVMDKGELRQLGPPRELYERPNSVFVARFFGAPAINLAPPEALSLDELAGRGLLVGVRAEDVGVGVGSPPSGARAGTVYLVEPLGAETLVTVDVGPARLTGKASGQFQASVGQEAWVRFGHERLHFFDARTGARADVH